MELRSARHGLTKSTGRFRDAADVRTTGSFRGALEPGFTERISNRWRFSGARIFKPIRLNFRKPGNSFELARWPRLRRTKPVHYLFSPTIQLTFPFNPISKVFFENHSDSKFQWLLTEMNAPGEARATGSPGGEFWTSLRRFRDYREELGRVQAKPALMLLNEERSAGRPGGGSESRVERSRSTPAPLSFTILHQAQSRWTPTLNEGSIHTGVWPAGQVKLRRDSSGNSETEKMFIFLRSIFAPGGVAPASSSLHSSLKTIGTVNAVALRQAFFTQLTLPESRSRLAAAAVGSFANSLLTFVVSNPVDATRRNQSLVTPTVLSYAKRESPQMQAAVNALRDLRPSQSEMRTPTAPQLPSVEQLTSQIRQQLERDLRIEKERRGL